MAKLYLMAETEIIARERDACRESGMASLLNRGPGVSRTQFSPLRPAVPRCSVEPVNERQGHRGPALRKSAVVRTTSILSAADVPLFSGLHVRDQRRSLAARFAQLQRAPCRRRPASHGCAA
jgi:hypothetical protein